MKRYFFYILLFLPLISLSAYNYLPNLTCYDKNDYQAGRQNWDIDIDDHGIVYFANTDGLLCNIYGEWLLKKVKGETTLRSVLADNDTIWVGGNEYGFFTKGKDNQLVYSHLGNIEGGLIWNIEKYQNAIYFQTEHLLIRYDKKTHQLEENYYDDGIWGLVEWRGQFWMAQRHGALGVLDGFEFTSRFNSNVIEKNEVRRLFVQDNQLYLVLLSGQIYTYDGNQFLAKTMPKELEGDALFAGMKYDDDTYCVGSVSGGFMQLSNDDKLINWVNDSHGLIDNTVLSMQLDPTGSIWLGLDYGVARLEMQSAINTIFNNGATYFITDKGEKTYLSTNKGLFCANPNQSFKEVPGTAGQVWRTRLIKNELLICHNNGVFIVEDDRAKHIYDASGVMDIARFGKSDFYLFSTYVGVLVMQRTGDSFKYLENIGLWGNPMLLYDEENTSIWTSNNYGEVHRVTIDEAGKVNKVLINEMKKVFETASGLYFYNNEFLMEYRSGRFVNVENPYIKVASGEGINALEVSKDKASIAFIQNGQVHLNVRLPDGNSYSFNKALGALSNGLMEGLEYIDIKDQLLRIATDRGVVVFDTRFNSDFVRQSLPVVSSVTVLSDENKTYYTPYHNNKLVFDQGNKDFHFRFGIHKSSYDVVEYRYRLLPKEQEWSEWSVANTCLYPQVKGGKHHFQLQSRINGAQEEETVLVIEIERMWYQTSWIILPIILGLVLWMFVIIYVMMRINKRKMARQKSVFLQKDAARTVKMKNEQLLQYTEIISHKNEFLNKVKTGLEKMRNAEAQNWANKITNEVNNEKKEFLFHKLFSEIHQDFIARITEEFPNLTANDVRLLSFIRINLDSREIANLMNISQKSVDTNRYRLRKKLVLSHEVDLNLFVREY